MQGSALQSPCTVLVRAPFTPTKRIANRAARKAGNIASSREQGPSRAGNKSRPNPKRAPQSATARPIMASPQFLFFFSSSSRHACRGCGQKGALTKQTGPYQQRTHAKQEEEPRGGNRSTAVGGERANGNPDSEMVFAQVCIAKTILGLILESRVPANS